MTDYLGSDFVGGQVRGPSIESDWSLHSCSCVGVTVRSPSVRVLLLLVNDTLLGRHRVSRGRTRVFTLQLKAVGIVRAEAE